MTRKVITVEFVVPTALAIALGIMLSVGAVYFSTDTLAPSSKQKPIRASAAGR